MITILIIAGSVFHYYFFYIPDREQLKIESEQVKLEQERQEKEKNLTCVSECTYNAETKLWNYFTWKGTKEEQQLYQAHFPTQESCVKYCISDKALNY